MKVVLGLISVLVLIVLVAILAQESRYLSIRRNLAGDRQALFHSGEALHVVSLLKSHTRTLCWKAACMSYSQAFTEKRAPEWPRE
jgi:hypothetical protein